MVKCTCAQAWLFKCSVCRQVGQRFSFNTSRFMWRLIWWVTSRRSDFYALGLQWRHVITSFMHWSIWVSVCSFQAHWDPRIGLLLQSAVAVICVSCLCSTRCFQGGDTVMGHGRPEWQQRITTSLLVMRMLGFVSFSHSTSWRTMMLKRLLLFACFSRVHRRFNGDSIMKASRLCRTNDECHSGFGCIYFFACIYLFFYYGMQRVSLSRCGYAVNIE